MVISHILSVDVHDSPVVQYVPCREMLMVGGFLIIYILKVVSTEKSAQLGPSKNNLAEVEVEGVRHLYSLRLYDLRKPKKVSNRERPRTLILIRSMTDEPGDDSSCVLFILNVEIEKVRWDASSVGLLVSTIKHICAPQQDVKPKRSMKIWFDRVAALKHAEPKPQLYNMFALAALA